MAKRWYSVSVLSNFEKKIAEQIKTSVVEANLEGEIEEVLVPTEEVIEVRRGKKVTAERRFMPGYVLVRMEMSDQGYHSCPWQWRCGARRYRAGWSVRAGGFPGRIPPVIPGSRNLW